MTRKSAFAAVLMFICAALLLLRIAHLIGSAGVSTAILLTTITTIATFGCLVMSEIFVALWALATHNTDDETSVVEPPRAAELCLTALLTGSKGEAVIGDLNERYYQDRQNLGEKRARRLYWARALKSLWPMLGRSISRAIRWGVVMSAVRRFF